MNCQPKCITKEFPAPAEYNASYRRPNDPEFVCIEYADCNETIFNN